MPVSIAVVIPTHDRCAALLRAIASVRLQSRAPDQIIVVADGCTDDSVRAATGLGDERIDVLDLEKGPGLGWGNRNRALERARTDAVAYLSDDDLWLPDHLARVGAVFDAGDVDLVQAGTCRLRIGGEIDIFGLDWSEPYFRELLMTDADQRTPMSAISHRTGLAEEVGGWNEHPSGMGDRDLWKRMVAAGARTVKLYEPTAIFLPACHGPADERERHRAVSEEQATELLARIADPRQLTRPRLEIARSAHRAQAVTERHVHALEARNAYLEELQRSGVTHAGQAETEATQTAERSHPGPQPPRIVQSKSMLDRS